MSLTRRGFTQAVGLGTAGILSNSFIIGRGLEAAEFEPELAQMPYDDGVIRISSNSRSLEVSIWRMMARRRSTLATRSEMISMLEGA